MTLVTQGPAAAWEQIKAELTELKDQLISQVTQMIQMEVVKAAVTKLVSMLNPAGAVIQAIIAIYNTVTFFIEKISQIGAVVASFIDSISAIAAGQVDGAAKRVEQTMANTLTVVIAFLAKFAGLGGDPRQARRDRQEDPRTRSTRASTRSSPGSARCSTSWWARPRTRRKKLLGVVAQEGADQRRRRAAHADLPGRDASSATLVVQSTPDRPRSSSWNRWPRSTRSRRPTAAAPLAKTRKHAKTISGLQTTLGDVDKDDGAAVQRPETGADNAGARPSTPR